MTIKTMIRQLRICEIIIICVVTKSLYGKSIDKVQDQLSKQKDDRFKRGYSHYGVNDFGYPIHVSSGVLQYSGGDEYSANPDSSSLDASLDLSSLNAGHADKHFESSASNADSETSFSPGYDVWLEPLPDYHASSALDTSTTHTSSIASNHPGSDHIVNTVFSDDSVHSAHVELPSSQLHTQIGSSSVGNSAVHISSSIHDHGALALSDNIDFNNDDGIKKIHYAKSFGK